MVVHIAIYFNIFDNLFKHDAIFSKISIYFDIRTFLMTGSYVFQKSLTCFVLDGILSDKLFSRVESTEMSLSIFQATCASLQHTVTFPEVAVKSKRGAQQYSKGANRL